ncbi:hypothetical protein M1L65_05940 [Slackia exigua]|uniref:hypothetical protein n=1 Tax=Slackia exigua TaxID=84109 RepID=UPI003BA3A035
MGGRGSVSSSAGGHAGGKRPSASEYRAAQSYRILHGDRHMSRLKARGATTKDIAKMYEHYHEIRMRGVPKITARQRAEKAAGFPPGVR